MDVQLVYKNRAAKAKTVSLRCAETIVGRKEGCNLRIPSPEVSRRHCRLTFENDVLMAEDLDSANGVYVNGQRLTTKHVVRPGDRLEIGPCVFHVKYQLSQTAIDHLLALDQAGEAAEEPTEMDGVATASEGEAAPPSRKSKKKEAADSDTLHVPLVEAAEDDDAASQEDAVEDAELVDDNSASVARVLDDISWQPPSGEDLRDILSRLDDG